jgi:hypothetical protein
MNPFFIRKCIFHETVIIGNPERDELLGMMIGAAYSFTPMWNSLERAEKSSSLPPLHLSSGCDLLRIRSRRETSTVQQVGAGY